MYSFSFYFICVFGLNSISGLELPHFGNLGPNANTVKHSEAKTPLTFFVPTFATRILNYTGKSSLELPHFGNLGSHWNTVKPTFVKTPLTFFVPTFATRLLNYTGKSMETIPNPKTIEILTGGILGASKYQILKGRFFWEQGINGTSLAIGFYFYNTKYPNFQNALKYPDGILMLFAPVETNDCTFNPLFITFGGIFEKYIKKPGDSAFINSFLSYKWYDHYSYDSVYTSYKGSIHDEEIGQKLTEITIIQLSEQAGKNFISKAQFADTFGSLTDSSGHPIENPLPQIHYNPSSVVESKAICVIQKLV